MELRDCSKFLLILTILFLSLTNLHGESPSIHGLTSMRQTLVEGEDLLLTCVVNNIGSNTVIWNKIVDGRKKMLAVDMIRLVPDVRVNVLHDQAPNFNSTMIRPGGDVWVLSIKNVTVTDAGGYMCRVNSDPPAQSYYLVKVQSQNSSRESKKLRSSHNYTDCCVENKVSAKCAGFCSIHNILEGKSGVDPEVCEKEFPTIVKCMADFRDHTDCCSKQGIPDLCQDLCKGEYTVQSDYVKSHFSCNAFTEPTLMCISEGIEILPKPPRSPSVEVIDGFSLKVQWRPPKNDSPPIDFYYVNVTTIITFNGEEQVEKVPAREVIIDLPLSRMQIKVAGNETNVIVKNLSALTWYEISVISVNKFGSSLAPYSIRALTLGATDNELPEPVELELPDIMGCCMSKGITHERCLQNLCNPTKRYIEEPDLIVCAVWAQETYSCLTGNVDHSSCCRKRGLPSKCVELCTGNVTKIDYTHFRCIDYFSDYRSCLLEGYGVLPGHPRNVKVSHVNPNFAFLSWDAPKKNSDSVTSYHAYYRPLKSEKECYEKSLPEESGLSYLGVHKDQPPLILENLCEDTQYEAYVEAFNSHGTSNPSQRIVFKTTGSINKEKVRTYNATECCKEVNLSPDCLPLCGYNVRMSHYKSLSATCTPEINSILRCMVGGRDHSSCCVRRGVPDTCLSLCTGSFSVQNKDSANCLPYLGNILVCLEEGVEKLPGPVTSLHATSIGEGKITIQWNPPESSNVSYYEIHYQDVDKYSASHAVYLLKNKKNVTEPLSVLENIKNNTLYNIFVISVNEWGTSLPSSVLTVNTTTKSDKAVAGVTSAPFGLLLEEKTADSLMVLWQPPLVSLPTDRIRYTIYHAAFATEEGKPHYGLNVTSNTAIKLTNLKPNSQYILFVTASNDHGQSRPSETLLAWTDPAYPAFVETPTVHPANLIVEGGTITVLCIAVGSPTPKVSLFISGVLTNQETSRHMVTIVRNVTRSMTEISCYAENGYGTPMQATTFITISHRPKIKAKEEVKVVEGTEFEIRCVVNAWPAPTMMWWKDVEHRIPVISGPGFQIDIKNVSREIHIMNLKITKAKADSYYCHASNPLGTYTHTIKVTTYDEIRQPLNVTSCCKKFAVKKECLSACDFNTIDYHKQINNDECLPELGKLLYCSADMSDHRGCCANKGVPKICLDWCRSRVVVQNETHLRKCLLEWAPPIFECFHEGKDTLPGPPEKVEIRSLTPTTARVSWKKPEKNPEVVDLYRVFWREKGADVAYKVDTTKTALTIRDMKEGVTYEIAVKAGNRKGTSLLSHTKTFVLTSPYITYQPGTGSAGTTAVSIIMSLIVVGAILAGIWYYRRKIQKILAYKPGGGGIAFENPSYVKEQTGDAVEISETRHNGRITVNTNVPLTVHELPMDARPEDASQEWGQGADSPSVREIPGFESDDNKGRGGYRRFNS